MITREQLEAMFANIAKSAGWDMTKPMLWGYFFTHTTPDALDRAAAILRSEGYRVVDVKKTDPEDDDPELWWLHVERVEVHSVDSLHERNAAFYRLVAQLGLESYDGVDVGPPPPAN
jgi:hypothetical protein